MQTNNDISANTASTDAISTQPAIVWRGDWVSDLDGIYETRAVVSACGPGFLPGLEVSFQGGEPVESAAVDAVGTLAVAMDAALALGRLWHRNNSELH